MSNNFTKLKKIENIKNYNDIKGGFVGIFSAILAITNIVITAATTFTKLGSGHTNIQTTLEKEKGEVEFTKDNGLKLKWDDSGKNIKKEIITKCNHETIALPPNVF